jgi:polyisoprenoid-binding protein YceI
MRLAPPVILLLLASSALAAENTLTILPDHAKVTFLLGATGHDVNGSFPLTKCDVHFDPETGAASGEIAIDAADAQTGNPKRDKAMHEKVLLTSASPSIVFHPAHFAGKLPDSGGGEVRLEGSVDIAGAQHPLTMVAHVDRTGDAMHVLCTCAIPYVEWGMKDPSVAFLKVDKVVQLTVEGDGALVTAPLVSAQEIAPGH